MKQLAACALIAAAAFASHASDRQAFEPAANSRALGVDIRISPEAWGSAPVAEIETALYAVADELVSLMPVKLAATPIAVSHTDGNPVALYERGPAGEYRVRLHASGDSWSLYVYEFAHELCHVLSNHDQHAGTPVRRHNQWFEETLCETASLYALAAVARSWELEPGASVWKARAPRLRRFFDRLLAEEARRLPAGTSLAAWLADQEPQLRANPYLREKNDLVAKRLLPLFEEEPRRWRALAYLNLHEADPTATLEDYLSHWNEKAPAEYRGFIWRVSALMTQPAGTQTTPTLMAEGAPPAPHASAGPLRRGTGPATPEGATATGD